MVSGGGGQLDCERTDGVPDGAEIGGACLSDQLAGERERGGEGRQGSVFPLRSVPAVLEIVLVGDGHHLGLISHQPDAPPHLRAHTALESSLSQEAVDSLCFVPALGQRHFR